MANNCRAKDPNSCRVHGTGGMMERLNKVAEEAYTNNDVMLYVHTRDQIESLSDDSEAPLFIAPDRGDLILENWTNKHGEIIPEAPNDMLLSNLYQSSYMFVKESQQVEDMLADRGYEPKDMFLAKHFRFKKADTDDYPREVTAIEVFRACTSVQEEVGFHPEVATKENFINQNFYFPRYDSEISKGEAQRFVDDYRRLVTEEKADATVSAVIHKNYAQWGFPSDPALNSEISGILKDSSKRDRTENGPSKAAMKIRNRLNDNFKGENSANDATIGIFSEMGRSSELGWILEGSRNSRAGE